MSFAQGTSVELTAAAGTGQSFSGWSGACSGTGTCTVMLNADTPVGAEFAAIPTTPPPTTPPPTTPPPTTPPPTTPPPTTPPPADECAGLLPASLPAPVTANLPMSGCLDGTSDDGNGNFLLGYTAGDGPSFPEYLFFNIQNGKAVEVGGKVLGGDESGTFIYSQPSGFTVYDVFGENGASSIKSYDRSGTLQSAQAVAPGNFSPIPVSRVSVDPSGGTAVAHQTFDTGTNTFTTYYRRFDKSGVPETGEVLLDVQGREPDGIGVALSGDALVMVLQTPGTWQARWLNRGGAPLTDWFTIQSSAGSFPIIRWLLDGSVVIGFNRGMQTLSYANLDYQFQILDGKTAVNAPPAWLQARANDVFYAIRGGKGYGAWSPTGSCVEALTSSGKSCGCLTVPSLGLQPSWGGQASIGRDGSLMVGEPPAANAGTCVWDIYPQLFK